MKTTTIPLLMLLMKTPIEEGSSNEPSASCHEGGASTSAAHDANYLQEDDLRNGGAWDCVDSVLNDDLRQFQASIPSYTDCNLLSGGGKKKKNKNRPETQENPGPGRWYTPAKQKDDGDLPRPAIPHCHICFRCFERNEGSLTGQCPNHCPVPQHMRYAVCGQCIEGKKEDEPPTVGVPSDDEKQEMPRAAKAARLGPPKALSIPVALWLQVHLEPPLGTRTFRSRGLLLPLASKSPPLMTS